ncbi:DUF4253 domain-containing protein [Nocardia sp. NPDC101769]|uniref:DUF4253 domain-containing protein n=1 Tax=Nocardia sp. NPDC101769 TaxID=3364333 RepID=UPI0037FA7158
MSNALGAAEFRPDSVAAASVDVVVGDEDPTAFFATLGVELPPLTRATRTVGGCTVWMCEVEPGYPATDLWQRARGVYERTGLWPVLLGLIEASLNAPGDQQVAAAAVQDGRAWLERAQVEGPRDAEGPCDDEDPILLSTYVLTEEDRDYEGFDWADAWIAVDELEEADRLALVPAPNPWLVPHLLNWSGARDFDLDGADHATLLRRWAGHWGAELIALSEYELVLRVANPPQDDNEALTVALEWFLYAPNLVYKGWGSLDELKRRVPAPLWRFLW